MNRLPLPHNLKVVASGGVEQPMHNLGIGETLIGNAYEENISDDELDDLLLQL